MDLRLTALDRYLGITLAVESAFHWAGSIGLILAISLSVFLVRYLHLSFVILTSIIWLAILIFLSISMITRIIVGQEILVYYHHQIAVIAGTVAVVSLQRQPLLPYLDVTVLGLGIFLACGRIGCLLVGCCYGRPSQFGITYGSRHAALGFPTYYTGVRLFPVQAVEAFWALGIVASGTSTILRGSSPGSVLAAWVLLYGTGRFCWELLRGDPDRPYLLGFSEAQWTSFVLGCLIVWAEFAGHVPFRLWHVAIAGFIPAIMLALAIQRFLYRSSTYWLSHPKHIREIADAIGFVIDSAERTDVQPEQPSPICVARTSLGVQISRSEIRSPQEVRSHYALSSYRGTMTEASAREVAKVICVLRHSSATFELIPGNSGIFHVLVIGVVHQSMPRSKLGTDCRAPSIT